MSAPSGPHYFEWEDAGGVAVVRFATKVIRDDRIIRTMYEQLDRLIEQSGRRKVLLNFAGVEAFASYAIGKLIVLNNKLQPPDNLLALCCLTPIVNEIVDIMKLRRQFRIYGSEPEALQALACGRRGCPCFSPPPGYSPSLRGARPPRGPTGKSRPPPPAHVFGAGRPLASSLTERRDPFMTRRSLGACLGVALLL